jgi:hypothetical protein
MMVLARFKRNPQASHSQPLGYCSHDSGSWAEFKVLSAPPSYACVAFAQQPQCGGTRPCILAGRGPRLEIAAAGSRPFRGVVPLGIRNTQMQGHLLRIQMLAFLPLDDGRGIYQMI